MEDEKTEIQSIMERRKDGASQRIDEPSIRSTWEPVTCLTPMVEAETCCRPALRRADKRAAIDMMGASVFDGGDGNLEM
jgi:hypothetical protein